MMKAVREEEDDDLSEVELQIQPQQQMVELISELTLTRPPRCCRPGHCCNAFCGLEQYGAGGFSLENALVYSNNAYQFFYLIGGLDSTWSLVLCFIALFIITISLTFGNYPANRNIVGRLLLSSSCFSRYKKSGVVSAQEKKEESKLVTVNGVLYTSLRVLIPSIAVYRTTSMLLRVVSLDNPVIVGILDGCIAVLNIPFALAFFDAGRNTNTMIDPDANMVVPRVEIIDEPQNLRMEHASRFEEEEVNTKSQFTQFFDAEFEGMDDREIENESSTNAGQTSCRRRKCCVSLSQVNFKPVIQQAGSVGYGLQSSALNFDTAYRYMTTWGWIAKQPIICWIGLGVSTASIAVGSYFSAHTLLDNYLCKFFKEADDANGAESRFDRVKAKAVKYNGPAAAFSKVTVATVNFFGVTQKIFFGLWEVATPLTIAISPAGVLANLGLFSLRSKSKSAGQEPETTLQVAVLQEEETVLKESARWSLDEGEGHDFDDEPTVLSRIN
jgi:hypothetical protein